MKKIFLLFLVGTVLLFIAACTTAPGPSVSASGSAAIADVDVSPTIPEDRLVNGTTVNDLFVLPTSLKNLYGSRKINFAMGEAYSVRIKKPPIEWRFVFTHPEGEVDSLKMAKAFLLYTLDRHFSERVPIADQEKSDLTDYGAYRLVGLEAPRSDRNYPLWWTLRMEGVEAPEGPVQDGERVLIGFRTYGYKGPGLSPGDFGHATLGVRTIGGDPADDFMINPGAVTPEGYKVSTKDALFGVEGVPNKVEIFNMWDWLEVQSKDRYLDIDYRILRVAPEQMEALELIKEEYDRLNWGSFTMLTNNCANGALDIYNLLLRIDLAEEETKKLSKVIVPEEVLDYASDEFTLAGQVVIPSDVMPEGTTKTPGAAYVELPNRSESKVYGYVLDLEKEVLAGE